MGTLPDKAGKLSLEERERASDKINETAQHEGDPCPHCGNVDTSVAEDQFQLAVANGPLIKNFIPVIPVVCNNCGFVRIFHSDKFGISAYPDSEDASKGEG